MTLPAGLVIDAAEPLAASTAELSETLAADTTDEAAEDAVLTALAALCEMSETTLEPDEAAFTMTLLAAELACEIGEPLTVVDTVTLAGVIVVVD